MTISTDNGHNDCITCQGQDVQCKEHHKKSELVLMEAGETLENKLSGESVVSSLH